MKRTITLIGIFSVAIFFVLYVSAQEGEMVEEEIRGVFIGVIEEKRPPIRLRFDPYEAVIARIGGEEFIYDRQLVLNAAFASSPLPVLASDQLVKPWLKAIVRGNIAFFNPIYGHDVVSWKITITDEKGSIFKTFEGEGPPPRTLHWDGRSNRGVMMNPGILYMYTAEAHDELGNVSRVVGREIRVKGIFYKERGENIVTLDGGRIFRENSDAFLDDGLVLLEEAADIVRENFRTSLTIQVYSRAEALSERRARALGEWFLERLIIPRFAIVNIAGFEEKVYKSSYINVIF